MINTIKSIKFKCHVRTTMIDW